MLDVLYNISVDFEIPTFEGEACSILITSDDNESCNIVYHILEKVFFNDDLVFKASGFPENIDCVFQGIKNCNPAYYEGDSKKFFVKRQPEVHGQITDKKSLSNIVNDWTSTIYERRFLFVLKEKQGDELFKVLHKNLYLEFNHLLSCWQYLNCFIENAPDAKYHNTFILTFRKEYLCKMEGVLKGQVYIQN